MALLLLLACGTKSTGACAADADCGFAESCIDSVCVARECATSAQCAMEERCEEGACVAGCGVDEDCYAGDYCETELHTCATEGCTDGRLDCGFNEVCDNATHTCVDAGGYYCAGCEDDSDCGGGGNLCVDLGALSNYCGVLCTSDADCPNGYSCIKEDNLDGTISSYQCLTYCWLYE